MSIIFKQEVAPAKANIIVVKQGYYKAECVKELVDLELFKADKEEVFTKTEVIDKKLVKTAYVGIGTDATNEDLRRSLAKGIKAVKDAKSEELSVHFDLEDTDVSLCEKMLVLFGEVYDMIHFEYKGYKTDLPPAKEVAVAISCNAKVSQPEEKITRGQNIAMGANVARQTANMPANYLYPETFANIALEKGKELGFEVEVISYEKLVEMKAGLILAVGASSEHKPCMVVMKYNGDGNTPYTAYVGKGITFDSGGYCLKSYPGIASMSGDMAGGGAALGTMCAVAANKLKTNLYVVVPLAENVIGETAILPGSVVTSLSGKTVEIANTDAEGRLILADALYYIAQKDEVARIYDSATLTGSTAMAFGGVCAGVMSNNDEAYDALHDASLRSGEQICRMTMFKEYGESLKSLHADLKNLSVLKGGGGISAAAFLEKFVEGKPWAHIDVAGITASEKEKPYTAPGATGYGAKLIYYILDTTI